MVTNMLIGLLVVIIAVIIWLALAKVISFITGVEDIWYLSFIMGMMLVISGGLLVVLSEIGKLVIQIF
jgi:hypothetical protein